MTKDLVARALAFAADKIPFRPRGPHEGERQYRLALAHHCEQFDFALAHELRVGRAQADWTHEDVAAFKAHIEAMPPSEYRPPAAIAIMDGGHTEPTEAALLEMAQRGLEWGVAFRRKTPLKEMAIIASVVLMDGQIYTTPSTRGDRVNVLKALAQNMPVFGFTLLFDAFIHTFHESGTARKQDALLMNLGTRGLRRTLVRPYLVRNGRAVFDPQREIEAQDMTHDPYAEVFDLGAGADGEALVRWFARTRQEWIAEMLFVYGFINRQHLMTKFDISEPQASNDLKAFMADRPGEMHYNLTRKRYEAMLPPFPPE